MRGVRVSGRLSLPRVGRRVGKMSNEMVVKEDWREVVAQVGGACVSPSASPWTTPARRR